MHSSPQFSNPNPNSSDGSKGSTVWIFVGCGCLLLLGLCVGSGVMVYFAMQRGQALGGSPGAGASPSASAPVGPPIPDRTVQATVTEATGSAADLRDTRCNFIVSAERSQRWASGIQCRAQVVCGGRLLFGGPEAGYFECTVTEQPRGVHGEDAGTTSANRDAALLLDSASSTLRVWDDATGPLGEYVVNARIDTVL